MYIKRYTLATLILIALLVWYVYAYITQGTLSIDLFGVPLPALPIAFLVVLPVLLLYVASIAHMFFYSVLGNLKLRKFDKDNEKIIDSIVDAYLGRKNRKHTFKTPRYKLLGSLIDNTVLVPMQTLRPSTENEKINAVIKLIEDINNGEVVDLKKYSLLSDNALLIQNDKNRYKKGEIISESILSNSSKFSQTLCEEAYINFVKTSPLYAIEKYKVFLTKTALFEILARINAKNNTLEISNQALLSLFDGLELDEKDYLKISTTLSGGMVPEQRMKLFETLSESKEEAMSAYLFTLFDLEMLAPADEILENSQPAEYLKFKSYRALKECNKNFNINLFI